MALGSTYNNNQTNNRQDITVYSNYRMNNAESKIDATCMTFRFWRTNLCIGIFPRKNTGNDEISFDMDNGIIIYLSHTKARMFENELKHFLEDPANYNSVGVSSGSAAITISNGSEYGKNNPVITIRKVDENGTVIASFAYEIKTDYYFSIRNYDGTKYDEEKDEYKYIEIEQLITVLDQYVKASTNAIAFSVANQQVYSFNRLDTKVELIAQSLGVELKSGNNGQNRYNNSTYFNKNSQSKSDSNVSYGTATLEDLE